MGGNKSRLFVSVLEMSQGNAHMTWSKCQGSITSSERIEVSGQGQQAMLRTMIFEEIMVTTSVEPVEAIKHMFLSRLFQKRMFFSGRWGVWGTRC